MTFLMAVTVVNGTNPDTGERDGRVILSALNLPGDVPAEMVWHYGPDTTPGDRRGDVYEVTLRRVPGVRLEV